MHPAHPARRSGVLRSSHGAAWLAGGAVLVLGLAGCAAGTTTATETTTTVAGATTTPAETTTAAVTALSVTDPWVKAADTGMTSAFGTFVNDGQTDVVVTGVTSEVSPTMELHETVGSEGAMQMREKEGGFTLPAGGELTLEPGGDHLMLMDLRTPVRAGEQVTFTLRLQDGQTMDVEAAVRPFTGAEEEYAPEGHS